MWESSKDLAGLVVPQAGRLVGTDDLWEPYRLVDADGVVVAPVAVYLRDLQAELPLVSWRTPLCCFGLDGVLVGDG
jgi:hypothetical protein